MTLFEELKKADSAAITAEQERCFEAIRQELKDVAGVIRQYIQTAAGPDGPPCEMSDVYFYNEEELLDQEIKLSIDLTSSVSLEIEISVALPTIWKPHLQQLMEGKKSDIAKTTYDQIIAGPLVYVNGTDYVDHRQMFFGSGNPDESIPDFFKLGVEEERTRFLQGLSRTIAYAKVLQPGLVNHPPTQPAP